MLMCMMPMQLCVERSLDEIDVAISMSIDVPPTHGIAVDLESKHRTCSDIWVLEHFILKFEKPFSASDRLGR